MTVEHVKSHFKCKSIPKKIDSHLTNFIVYDLESHNTDRARSYIVSFYRLSKVAGRYSLDLTLYETEKCKNNTFVFDGEDCVTKAIDFLLKFKGEERRGKN